MKCAVENDKMANNIQPVKYENFDPIFGVQSGMGFKSGGASSSDLVSGFAPHKIS